jgi:opacity protein-like surface antigen
MKTALLALTLFSVPALAQVAEFGVHGGVSRINNKEIGSLSQQTQTGQIVTQQLRLDDGWRFGFRLTLNNWRFAGHEFGYAYNRTGLDFGAGTGSQGMAIHQGFYNFLLYATPEGSKVRPFVTGGGHFSNFVPPGASATQGSGDNKIGFNYGAGVKFRVTEKWLARIDYRDYITGKPFDLPGASGKLRQTEISVGVSFTL